MTAKCFLEVRARERTKLVVVRLLFSWRNIGGTTHSSPTSYPAARSPHPVVFLWFLAIFSDITNTRITLNLPWPVINTTIFIKWAQSITMTEVCSFSSFIAAFHTRFFVLFQEKVTPTSRRTTKVRPHDCGFKIFIILSEFVICNGCWVIWNTQYYIYKWNNRNLAKGE